MGDLFRDGFIYKKVAKHASEGAFLGNFIKRSTYEYQTQTVGCSCIKEQTSTHERTRVGCPRPRAAASPRWHIERNDVQSHSPPKEGVHASPLLIVLPKTF